MTTNPASKEVSGDKAMAIAINTACIPFFGIRVSGFCKNRTFAVSKSYTNNYATQFNPSSRRPTQVQLSQLNYLTVASGSGVCGE